MPQFDLPIEEGGRPLRESEQLHERIDAAGLPVTERLGGKTIIHKPGGTIYDAVLHTYLHCGHPSTAGVGGRCTVEGCMNVSCPACYESARCQICFAGCCLEHKHELIGDNGLVRVVCRRCKDRIQRQVRVRKITRLLLAPFVDFGKDPS